MDIAEVAYNGEFTIEERKTMTAQVFQELRKVKKLSQKEVAAKLSIPATTYNTYESGRTEPPIEILVRLSHLYGISVDLIVQRDRTYATADDIVKQMTECQEMMGQIEQEITEKGTDFPGVEAILATMNKMAEAMKAYSQTEAARKVIDKPFKKD